MAMEKSNQMGRNRTGLDMSPMHSKKMVSNAQDLTHPSADDGSLASIERDYIREADALGSVPVPGTMKGALKAAAKKATGRNPEMLINKLGERLAYERSGVRLYEAFMMKCEAEDGESPVSMDRLAEIRDEEAQHFHMLKEALESLGADPTAQTPDADVAAVASMGVQKVMSDPRTTVGQCLEALLTAELTDHAGWELLIKLSAEMGLDELADQFRVALEEEEEHLRDVNAWTEKAVLAQAGLAR